METRKKRKQSNALMAVLVAVVVLCGIMAAGSFKGWFGSEDSSIECEEITGIVNIQRDGIAYRMKVGQRIEAGDILETGTASEAGLKMEDNNRIAMNENTEIVVTEDNGDGIELEAAVGEIFADIAEIQDDPKHLEIVFGENKAVITGAIFSISVQQGSAAINVYEGTVEVIAEDGTAHKVTAGKMLSAVHTGEGSMAVDITDLSVTSLSNFILSKSCSCSSADKLCFSADTLRKALDERNAENPDTATGSGVMIAAEKNSDTFDKSQTGALKSKSGKNGESGKNESKEASGSSSVNHVKSCTITIRCDTILNNMGNLKEGKDRYVPVNGVILASSTVEFREGETVFDVLKRACHYTGIPLEYSYTPLYGSYYVEGINNLYEFDCGDQSGWMYKVNGWYPNYGCSNYKLNNGDSIVWSYTCNGLGVDVGGGVR